MVVACIILLSSLQLNTDGTCVYFLTQLKHAGDVKKYATERTCSWRKRRICQNVRIKAAFFTLYLLRPLRRVRCAHCFKWAHCRTATVYSHSIFHLAISLSSNSTTPVSGWRMLIMRWTKSSATGLMSGRNVPTDCKSSIRRWTAERRRCHSSPFLHSRIRQENPGNSSIIKSFMHQLINDGQFACI